MLALELKPLIAKKAKKKQASHTDQGYQKSDKPVHATKELARIADVSHDTIHKVEHVQNSSQAKKAADPWSEIGRRCENGCYLADPTLARNLDRVRQIKRLPKSPVSPMN